MKAKTTGLTLTQKKWVNDELKALGINPLKEIGYNGRQKAVRIMYDRQRTVNYNGGDIEMNCYECSSCKHSYHAEIGKNNYCPACGTRYKYTYDVSA